MANENQVITSIFYLTRACNIDCSYCRIWDNRFPNELSLDRKKEALRILWQEVKTGFILLFGGEPLMLGDGLEEIIRYCGKMGIRYAVTSNSIQLTQEKAQHLVNAGLMNWSISLDYISELIRDPIGAKSRKGLDALHMLKEMGVPDLHATITVTKKNIDELIPIVEYCNKHGFWSEVTALHYQKEPHYYFASPKESMPDLVLDQNDMARLDPIMQELKEMKEQGYLIHNDAEYFDAFNKYAFNLNWCCTGMSSMVVDADGMIKTCLHYNHIYDWSIFDLDNQQRRQEFFDKYSGNHPCEGCFWDCKWQSELWRERDPAKGREVFQHV